MIDSRSHFILVDHLRRYPQMQVADLYKLLHQATWGSGHAVLEKQAARDQLERESKEMGGGPEEPLLDPLPPDGELVRVHLRPYLASGKDLGALLQAFVRTAYEWRGSLEMLERYGAAAACFAEAEQGRLDPKKIEAFFAKMEAQGFPAVHHSETYSSLYRPAYRVVVRQLLEKA